MPADTELILGGGGPCTIVLLSHQQVSPWPFKGLASGTKEAERCCFKPLQALQILSCCFLTGPTQPGTACLTLWLLMSESTCSLRLSSLVPFPSLVLFLSPSFLPWCHFSYLQQWVKMRGREKGAVMPFASPAFFLLNTHCDNISDLRTRAT